MFWSSTGLKRIHIICTYVSATANFFFPPLYPLQLQTAKFRKLLKNGKPHDLEEDERRHLGPHSPAAMEMITSPSIY
jgi:hypothetical protein